MWVAMAASGGCAPAGGQQYLTSHEAQATLVRELPDCEDRSKIKPCERQQLFYVVVPAQLPRLRAAHSLTYLGSDADHHYFATWNKVLPPPQIADVAVTAELCDVKHPRPLARLDSTQPSVDLAGGGCAVH